MIEKKTVEYIAELARLQLTEQEEQALIKDLNSILTYMEQLNQADTKGVEPTAFVTAAHNPLREDTVKDSLDRNDALSNGPVVKKGFFAVPKVIG